MTGQGKEVGSSTVGVSGANGVHYELCGVRVRRAPTYHWVAEYSGDATNLPPLAIATRKARIRSSSSRHRRGRRHPNGSLGVDGTATFTIEVANSGEVNLEKMKAKDLAALENALNNGAQACGVSRGVQVFGSSEAHVGIEMPESKTVPQAC